MPASRNQPTTTDPADSPEKGVLFRLLLAGGRDASQVYTAIQEIQSMAGESAVTQLTGLIQTTATELEARLQASLAEQSTRFQTALAEQSTRFQTALAEQGARFQIALAKQGAQFEAALAEQGAQFQAALAKQGAQFQAALTEMDTRLTARLSFRCPYLDGGIADAPRPVERDRTPARRPTDSGGD